MHETPPNAWHILTSFSLHQQLDFVSPLSASAPSPSSWNKILINLLNWSPKQENNVGIVVTLPVIFKHIVLYKYSSSHMKMLFWGIVCVCVQTNVYSHHYTRHMPVTVGTERCPWPLFVDPSQLLFSSQPFILAQNQNRLFQGLYSIPRDHIPGSQGRRNILRGRLSAHLGNSFCLLSLQFHILSPTLEQVGLCCWGSVRENLIESTPELGGKRMGP